MKKNRNWVHWFALITAIIIGVVFYIAAIGKLFYPFDMPQPWKGFSYLISVFELAFPILLLCYYKRTTIWIISAAILSSWVGYSLFWLFTELPCGCMGKMFNLPTKVTFSFDVIFSFVSLVLTIKLNHFSILTIVLMGLCGLIGYFSAEWFFSFIT